jgi:diguanylate cyclase (GGDEF)-like protein
MTKKAVFIDDLSSNPLTNKVKNRVKALKGESVLVVPIVWHDDVLGTLFLRTKRPYKRVTQREIDFCQVVANASFHALKNAQLFNTLQKENSQLKRLSITDQLTNIYNHGYFYARLEEEFDRASRYDTILSCIMIDIDNFKMVNDSYGHTKGDDVLREVAQAIKRTIRKSDLVARYGGEEFAILLPHTDLERAMKGAERVRKVIENLDFTNVSKDFRVTVSAGVATFPEKGLDNSRDIIALADKALYEAKKRGKNRTFAYMSQVSPLK